MCAVCVFLNTEVRVIQVGSGSFYRARTVTYIQPILKTKGAAAHTSHHSRRGRRARGSLYYVSQAL